MPNLDQKDAELLEKLQEDARLPNAQLAEATAMSASSCWRRTKSLEDAGVIRGYSVIVEPKKVGLNFEAIVHLNLDRHNDEAIRNLVQLLNDCDEVIECFATTGDYDYHLRVLCRDIDAYHAFQENKLFRNKSIRSMRTNVVLKRIKNDAPVKPVL